MPAARCVSAELPETGERFEGLLPPVVAAPAFAIRKPAVAVFTLEDYVAAGIMTAGQAAALRSAVAERRNILVAGGTSTGKTTLTNALLAEVASDRRPRRADRGHARAAVPRAEPGRAAHQGRRRLALRSRPLARCACAPTASRSARCAAPRRSTCSRPGAPAIPAASAPSTPARALGALRRLEQLIQEAVVTVPRALIAETIDVIAVLAGRGADRRLAELARVAAA